LLLGVLLVSTVPLSRTPAAVPESKAHAESGAASGIAVSLFGQPLEIEPNPLLVNGVALVPLREVAEALGARVDWNEATETATVTKGSTVIRLTVGSAHADKNGRTIALAAAPQRIGGVVMAPARLLGESFGALVRWDDDARAVVIDKLPELPTVGSFERLREIVKEAEQYGMIAGPVAGMIVVDQSLATADTAIRKSASGVAAEVAPAASAEKTKAVDFSSTNTQVEGVDEADLVKTDGTYLYQVNGQRVFIVQASPASDMRLAGTIDFGENGFQPQELYVDGDELIVIGSALSDRWPMPKPASAAERKLAIAPIYENSSVKVFVYDIADKSNPKSVRKLELEGRYVTSRKIGSSVYLVTNKYANIFYPANRTDSAEPSTAAPAYRDSAVSDQYATVDFKDIRYFPGSPEASYLLVAGFDLRRPDEPMDVQAYLGSGQNVYVSEKHLYAAVSRYEPAKTTPAESESADGNLKAPKRSIPADYIEKTTVYKFRLDQGKTTFVAQGEVPGRVLNQFSMDEHDEHFRIATTTGKLWRTDEDTSKNNVYVLDEAMMLTGKLENIAPGEQIYAVRFMGNRAYMVTFKTVDPLFVLDLGNPREPAVLGALKIPGYSDYLHPYDETHLIGFGKETVEVPVKGDPTDPKRTMAYYQGMKIALFDVSDVANPVELFKETIGDRGTDSELLRNHKALMFAKEKHLLAFPVQVMELANKTQDAKNVTEYGQFTFQGAYVYRLDLTNGFDLQAKITHLSEAELRKAGNGWYDSKNNVERILYIGDTLYTLSKGKIQANDMATWQVKGQLVLP